MVTDRSDHLVVVPRQSGEGRTIYDRWQITNEASEVQGLRLVGCWFEGSSDFIIVVKPYKNGCRCPSCDRRGKVIRTMPARRWRDLPIREWSVFLQYAPREIRCPTHGRLVERIPWAERSSRMTYRFEYALLRYCQVMTQRAAAELLVIPKSTLSNLLHRAITRLRKGHLIRGLKTIGIDEISYAKGHKYATLVYDLDRSCVVWIGRGKARNTIDRFFYRGAQFVSEIEDRVGVLRHE